MGTISAQLEAGEYGWRLTDTECEGVLLWGWRRGDDATSPLFSSDREAADWMEHQLRNRSLASI